MQAWFDGTLDPNKGVIFQADANTENGTTINYRTFASYNRSKYKPTLVVEYMDAPERIVPDEQCYINNFYHGKFLKKEDRYAICSGTGTVLNLEHSGRWRMRQVGGGYVIYTQDDPDIYLSVPDAVTSTAVILTEVDQAHLPQNCIWSIERGAFGHYLIKNTYNSKYLKCNGATLSAISNVNANTITYNSCVWRMESILDNNELPLDFAFSNLEMDVGKTIGPQIQTTATWASATDFTYSFSSNRIELL